MKSLLATLAVLVCFTIPTQAKVESKKNLEPPGQAIEHQKTPDPPTAQSVTVGPVLLKTGESFVIQKKDTTPKPADYTSHWVAAITGFLTLGGALLSAYLTNRSALKREKAAQEAAQKIEDSRLAAAHQIETDKFNRQDTKDRKDRLIKQLENLLDHTDKMFHFRLSRNSIALSVSDPITGEIYNKLMGTLDVDGWLKADGEANKIVAMYFPEELSKPLRKIQILYHSYGVEELVRTEKRPATPAEKKQIKLEWAEYMDAYQKLKQEVGKVAQTLLHSEKEPPKSDLNPV